MIFHLLLHDRYIHVSVKFPEPIFVGFVIMWLDKKPIRPMLKGLFLYPLFLGSWMLINFKCLFIRDTRWEKIDHVRNVNAKNAN